MKYSPSKRTLFFSLDRLALQIIILIVFWILLMKYFVEINLSFIICGPFHKMFVKLVLNTYSFIFKYVYQTQNNNSLLTLPQVCRHTTLSSRMSLGVHVSRGSFCCSLDTLGGYFPKFTHSPFETLHPKNLWATRIVTTTARSHGGLLVRRYIKYCLPGYKLQEDGI